MPAWLLDDIPLISIPAPARGRTWLFRRGCRDLFDFNSRPREGANIGGLDVLVSDLNFNSRPREGANAIFVVAAEMYDISIPAPARGRTDTIRALSALIEFQFPPPRGGEPGKWGSAPAVSYFNSRPREGANCTNMHLLGIQNISIPAPARGRTDGSIAQVCREEISIPAPARGRTDMNINKLLAEIFQFPPPRGGEHMV